MPITSSQNLLYKKIIKLIQNKQFRNEEQLFWVDGVNFVNQAIENNWEIEKLVYVPEKLDTNFKQSLLNIVSPSKHIIFTEKLYSKLSTKKNIQGIGAIIKQKYFVNQINPGVNLILENISNPGNLGTIIRNCVAFNIKNLVIINPSVDLFNIETIRATMGALFSLNVSIFEDILKMKDQINILNKDKAYLCLGTAVQDESILLREYKKRFNAEDNVLLFFGSEAKGMSDVSRNLCHDLIKIEISHNVDSLNIAESTAILMYQLFPL